MIDKGFYKDPERRLIVNFYITYNCNLSCEYCIVYSNFLGHNMNKNKEEYFTHFFKGLYKNYKKFFKSIVIEFFGGEPLLKRKYINKFIKTFWNKFVYTITTNWLIRDNVVQNIYKEMEKINVSVHYYKIDFLIKLLPYFKNFNNKVSFTLVLDKKNIFKYYNFVDKLFKLWFRNINILPVFLKYNWHNRDFKELARFLLWLKKYNYFDVKFLYYNPQKKDIEFSLDIRGNTYSFNWEIIFFDAIKNQFYIDNIMRESFNYSQLLDGIIFKRQKHLQMNLFLNAILRTKVKKVKKNFSQSIQNYIKLNKFLYFYEKFFKNL